MITGDRAEHYLDLDLDWKHLSEALVAFVPSVSIEDRPLLLMVVRS